MPVLSFKTHEIQLNLSTTATLEAEESGRCIKRGGHSGEVLIKSQCMDFLSTATKKAAVVQRWQLGEVQLMTKHSLHTASSNLTSIAYFT